VPWQTKGSWNGYGLVGAWGPDQVKGVPAKTARCWSRLEKGEEQERARRQA